MLYPELRNQFPGDWGWVEFIKGELIPESPQYDGKRQPNDSDPAGTVNSTPRVRFRFQSIAGLRAVQVDRAWTFRQHAYSDPFSLRG